MELAPIILHANRIELAGHADLTNGPVCSRMLLRCLAGEARLVVQGTATTLHPGEFLFLPWHHTIRYLCRSSKSFLVDGIHLVPVLPPDSEVPLRFEIPHRADAPLARSRHRRDATLPGLDGIVSGHFEADGRLDRLCQYIVDCYVGSTPQQWQARHLADLLLPELRRTVRWGSAGRRPASLLRVMGSVRADIRRSYRVADLAAVAGCSTPTLTRMFRRHCGLSPVQWLLRERLGQAAGLLTATSLSIEQVGRHVGVDDPYYFSKLFRRLRGQTPTSYRKARALL